MLTAVGDSVTGAKSTLGPRGGPRESGGTLDYSQRLKNGMSFTAGIGLLIGLTIAIVFLKQREVYA